jgi:hypothetical protein
MSILNRIKDVARYRDRSAVHNLADEVAGAVANRLPRAVVLYAVTRATNEAVRIRECDRHTRQDYWGPQGIEYEHMHDAMLGINTELKRQEREAKRAVDPESLEILADGEGFTVFNTSGDGSMTFGPFPTRELAEACIDDQRELMRKGGFNPGRYEVQAPPGIPSIDDLKGGTA